MKLPYDNYIKYEQEMNEAVLCSDAETLIYDMNRELISKWKEGVAIAERDSDITDFTLLMEFCPNGYEHPEEIVMKLIEASHKYLYTPIPETPKKSDLDKITTNPSIVDALSRIYDIRWVEASNYAMYTHLGLIDLNESMIFRKIYERISNKKGAFDKLILSEIRKEGLDDEERNDVKKAFREHVEILDWLICSYRINDMDIMNYNDMLESISF